MKRHTLIYSLDEVDFAARELRSLMPFCSVFTFVGMLGAGKTTLIQALFRQCGIDAVIQSPTFTYLVPYINQDEQRFYHFDLYRLKDGKEFVDAGFSEYLYQPESWAFIEWPEIIMPVLKKSVCHVSLDYLGEEQRVLRYYTM